MPATFVSRLYFFALIAFLGGCSSTASVESIRADPANQASYDALQLVVLTPETRNRRIIENALLQDLENAGFKAYPLGQDPVKLFADGSGDLKDQVRRIANANGADSALVVSLLDAEKVESYVEPRVITTPVTVNMSPMVGTMMKTTMAPGYYDTPDTVYSIRSTLFDLASEKSVLEVYSKNINSGSIEQGAADFARVLVDTLHPDYLRKR